MSGYIQTVQSAGVVLPIAVQMEELFPVADHFITEFGFDRSSGVWNTEVFFRDRYVLTMQVDVEIDYKANKITKVAGEPQFYLREVDGIEMLPDHRALASYNGANSRHFDSKQWEAVYEQGGNLSPLGIKENSTGCKHFGEYVSQWRRDRIPVSLLEKR